MFMPEKFMLANDRTGEFMVDYTTIDQWTSPSLIKEFFPSAETVLPDSDPDWSVLRIKTSEDIVLTLHFYIGRLKKMYVAHEDGSPEKSFGILAHLGERSESLWGKISTAYQTQSPGMSILIEYY